MCKKSLGLHLGKNQVELAIENDAKVLAEIKILLDRAKEKLVTKPNEAERFFLNNEDVLN